MQRFQSYCFVLTLCVITLLAASAGSVPLSILEDPTHPLNRTEPISEPKVEQLPSFTLAVPDYQSGDTVFLFCEVGKVTFGSFGGSDCWGWQAPDETEYAIMGIDVGVAFVNTATMTVADIITGPQSSCAGTRWRDMVTYQNYCYCVSECSGTNDGLMVMDMQYLPDSVHLIGTVAVDNFGDRTSHNLAIDTINGYAYAEGFWSASTGFSVHILSLANPENPTYINSFGTAFGIHDMYAMNDTVYVAEGDNSSFSIWNLANKNSPQLITRVTIPASGYVHNIWPTRDRNYVVTTEETANNTVKIWDIQNLGDIQLVGQYLAPSNLVHNAQIEGDTLFLSHYESGVAVVDISDASTPVEIGIYDTYSGESPNFNGCWGVFPHTVSGRVYGSNMDGRLFILEFDEVILADTLWVDTVSGTPGAQVRVDVHATNTIPISQFVIPVLYSGPFNLTLDSVSKVGLRTEYFEQLNTIASDPANKRKAYSLVSSPFGTSRPLDPGTGPVLSLYFSIPGGASGSSNPISLTPFAAYSPIFAQNCISYTPDTAAGAIVFGLGCCDGIRGNVDGDIGEDINVTDLSYLVDYLFKSGPVPPCNEEGNVDGDIGEEIVVTDLTYLVDYLFKSGPAPGSCP